MNRPILTIIVASLMLTLWGEPSRAQNPPGITHNTVTDNATKGQLHYLVIDGYNACVRVEVFAAKTDDNVYNTKEQRFWKTPQQMVEQSAHLGAVAAINTDYFSNDHAQEGITYINGVHITGDFPVCERTSLAISQNNSFDIGWCQDRAPELLYNVTGAGPQFLINGDVRWEWRPDGSLNGESFADHDWDNRKVLSAGGISRDGRYMILGSSNFALFPQDMAARLRDQGAYQGMRFDGGASAQLYFNGQALNPQHRVVPAGLVVYTVPPPFGQFCDVTRAHVFFKYITDLATREYTTGFGDGTFRPDLPITRAQVTKFIARAAGDQLFDDGSGILSTQKPEVLFPDVPDNHQFYEYIRFLTNLEDDDLSSRIHESLTERVIFGKEDGSFHPDDLVTRGELASMVGRTLVGKGKSCPDAPTRFPDVAEGSTHERYITCLKNHHLIDGYPDGNFRPDAHVTRGEAAKFVSNMIRLTEGSLLTSQAAVARSAQVDAGVPQITAQQTCTTINVGNSIALQTTGFDAETDCLQVTVDSNESQYVVGINNQGWNANIKIEVRDPAGTLVAEKSQIARLGAFSFVWTPTTAGTYSILLHNMNPFAKESVGYSLNLDQISGNREFRVDPAGAGVCGEDNHIQLEVQPLNNNEVEVEIRKCDFEQFEEGGEFWILVDNVVTWGPFAYNSGVSRVQQTVQPLAANITGRHRYKVKMHPNYQAERMLQSGEVRVWDFYPERDVDFRDIDYIYQVAPPDTNCGGIIELRLRPRSHQLQARVQKCDGSDFSSSGKLWILAEGVKRWGPFPFEAGDDDVFVYLDPKGAHDILWYEEYEAWIYSNCDHGASGCNPNEVIDGGEVRATPYLRTSVTARQNGMVWDQVAIWRTSVSGSPDGNGEVVHFLPDGTGFWDYYLQKVEGYTANLLVNDPGVSLREEDDYFVVRLSTGSRVSVAFVPICHQLLLIPTPLSGGEIVPDPAPNCQNQRYLHGTSVTLTAHPQAAFSFSGWQGDAAGTELNTVVVMDDDKTVSAILSPPCYSLTLLENSGTEGNVTVATAPNCTASSYTLGTDIVVQASPADGFAFKHWSGDFFSYAAESSFTILGDMEIAANFGQPPSHPELTTPESTQLITTSLPTFTWQSAQNATQYQLMVSTAASSAGTSQTLNTSLPSAIVIDVTTSETSYTPTSPMEDGEYVWIVRAGDEAGNWSEWSESRSFAISTAAESVIELHMPFIVTP